MTDLLTLRESLAARIAPSLVEKRNIALRQAQTDRLTGIGNREAYELATAGDCSGMAFILFDANNFGKVNKTAGHIEGDKILKIYGETIGEVARRFKCRAFRYGGDEFVIIVSNALAKAVRDAVESRLKPVEFDGFTVSMSGAIGNTLAAADSILQQRKQEKKQNG